MLKQSGLGAEERTAFASAPFQATLHNDTSFRVRRCTAPRNDGLCSRRFKAEEG
jgi:hypothetical protein